VVRTTYADNGGTGWASEQGFARHPYQQTAWLRYNGYAPTGFTRAEYVSAGDTVWQHLVHRTTTYAPDTAPRTTVSGFCARPVCSSRRTSATPVSTSLLVPLFDDFDVLDPVHRDALRVAVGIGGGPAPDRLLTSTAVLLLLRLTAARMPLLLVVDDLPWLDLAANAVLGFVARRLIDSRVGFFRGGRLRRPSEGFPDADGDRGPGPRRTGHDGGGRRAKRCRGEESCPLTGPLQAPSMSRGPERRRPRTTCMEGRLVHVGAGPFAV
jgi:hypothetical protein